MPEGYSIRDMASDQAQAMQKLRIRRYSVMGVSQGGLIAQLLAAFYPENVERLVIAVSAPCVNKMIRENICRWTGFAEKGDHQKLMIDTAERSYSPKYLEKFRKMYPLLGHVGKPKDYRRFMVNAEAILSFDAREELEKICCPTLILGGKEDKTVGPDASYELHERIAGSELYMYDGLGHAAYEEAADFNDRVFRFLAE
jgi:pimeloyl-ACP methyl ester carboxylesterase